MAYSPPSAPLSPSALSPRGTGDSSSSHLDLYFGDEVYHSPDNSGSDDGSGSSRSSSSSSNDSQATLDDIEVYSRFGHPLERMFRVGSTDDEESLFRASLSRASSSSFTSSSSSSATSSVVYDIDYEALIDNLLVDNPSSNTASTNMIMVEPSSPELRDSLMIKCLSRTSPELYILLELNHPELRIDPWNPAPHILCAVEREDRVFLCMERLNPYDEPPFQTVANYIDFFRQILEGLTFLHELKIAHVSFQDSSCYMVDLSSAPSTCLSPVDFDRTRYPVRYYFMNLSGARKIEVPVDSATVSPFRHDVQDCGVLIDHLLIHVPRIGAKFQSLVKAMTLGGFGADDSRKLFEALCKSLESSTLDTAAPAPEVSSRSISTLCIPRRSAPLKLSLPSSS